MNRLGDGDVYYALAMCPQLAELDCSFTACCSDIELNKAATGGCCAKLRVLNVRYCPRVTDLGLMKAVQYATASHLHRLYVTLSPGASAPFRSSAAAATTA
jgi:hypothetical protein